MTPDDVRRVLSAAPERTALLFDFDGTLAPIVADPASAAAAPGAVELLDRLAQRYRRVAAVSGRPRSFLASRLGPSVDLSGLYGLETRFAGVERDHDEAETWRQVIDGVVEDAALPDGVNLEAKGLSITVHFRQQPSAEPAVQRWADSVATRTGLEVRPAKASVELHPPLAVDKGSSVRELAEGSSTIVYCGDDVGDLPAFAALDDLATEGCETVRIVVAGDELPDAVAEVADLVVPDPIALVELFAPLAPAG